MENIIKLSTLKGNGMDAAFLSDPIRILEATPTKGKNKGTLPVKRTLLTNIFH